MNFMRWNLRTLPVRRVSPHPRETSLKRAVHIDEGVIAHKSGIRGHNAESFKRTFKNPCGRASAILPAQR